MTATSVDSGRKTFFYKNLRGLLIREDITVSGISRDIGKPASTLSRYLNKGDWRAVPKQEIVNLVAARAGYSPEEFVYADLFTDVDLIEPQVRDQRKTDTKVPVYSVDEVLKLPAGEPKPCEFSDVPIIHAAIHSSDFFGFKMHGNALAPSIAHGDTVFCYHFQPEFNLRDGALVLAAVELDGRRLATLGYLAYDAFGDKTLSVTFGMKARSIPLTDDDIIGVAVLVCKELL